MDYSQDHSYNEQEKDEELGDIVHLYTSLKFRIIISNKTSIL